jgi:hypothetical protein
MRLIDEKYEGSSIGETHEFELAAGASLEFSLETATPSAILSVFLTDYKDDSYVLPEEKESARLMVNNEGQACGQSCHAFLAHPGHPLKLSNLGKANKYVILNFDYQFKHLEVNAESLKVEGAAKEGRFELERVRKELYRHLENCDANLERMGRTRFRMKEHQERMLWLTMLETLVVLLLSYLQYRGIKSLFNPAIF